MHKLRQGDLFQTSFLLLKKLYRWSKQEVSTLVLIYFVRPRLSHTIKTNLIKFQTVDPKIATLNFIFI